MTLSPADARFMVEALLSRQFIDRLSEWEEEFARSLLQRLDGGPPLTPKQAETLERVFDRINRP